MNTASSGSPTIRAYRPGDERALVELWEEVFGHAMTEEHWRWKLKHVWCPVENVGLAVTEDDRPVFHIGGIPCRFHLRGREGTVMVAVDAMTAPPFRRRGLLAQVGRHMWEQWRQADIPLVLGLPNEQYNKAVLHWRPLFPLTWLIRPLRPESLLARRLRFPALARIGVLGWLWNALWDGWSRDSAHVRVRELQQAGPEIDLLWRNCRDGIAFSVIRDSAWLNWRYFAAPHYRYRVVLAERKEQPVGYAVYRVKRGTGPVLGFIPEIFHDPDDREAGRSLMAEVLRRMKAERVEAVATLAVPKTTWYHAWRRAGFLFSWGSFSVECAILDPALTLEQISRPQGWHLVGGDFDVI